MRLWIALAAIAVVIAAFVASAAPGSWPVRFVVTLLLEGLAVFIYAGLERLSADSKVVDDHPDQQLNLMRDSRGHVIGAAPFGLGPAAPSGFEKGL